MSNSNKTLIRFYTFVTTFRSPILLVISLIIVATLHGYNMFYYPYFESDEGTYLSQAYTVREMAELAPYVYWYDHPPFGWFTIATWINILQGDWNAFGSSLNTGRFFMWFLHIVQASLVFFITQRLTRRPWLAFIAVIIFSVPPLATYFQRRVLLDNLLTTWVLLAFAILHVKELRLRHVLMSGAFFGAALITKITTVLFIPAFLYLLIMSKWPIHRGFRLFGWGLVSGSIFSLWFIFASIKTELFVSGDGSRVSLIGTILYQFSRGTEYPFWHQDSSFMDNVRNWLILDMTYVYIFGFGLMCALYITLVSHKYRFVGLAVIFYFLFLIRGGIVIGFYILPMLPFIAMSIVLTIDIVCRLFKDVRLPAVAYFFERAFVVACVGFFIFHYNEGVKKYLTTDETSNQIEALRWVKENLPEDARIITDIYGYTELVNPDFYNEKSFLSADWYFKVARDPAIRYSKYRDDWRNFDYVLISHEMLYQTALNDLPVVGDAIRNSEPVARWDKNTSAFIDIQNFISTNGDWAALHRINNNTRTQLKYAWNLYRDTFIESYGQVVDPQTGNTTSEGQSYALLRAVLMNDRDAFKGVWLWTKHHMQHRLDDSLLSWLWRGDEQIDSANATDADLDTALALIFASKMFNEPSYLLDAQKIIADIWRQTVVDINGRYYLLPSEHSYVNRSGGYLLNPSYFSPAHYRIFADVDTPRRSQWLQLADDTYATLQQMQNVNSGAILPRNWIFINNQTGMLSSATPYITQGGADVFSYDAFRTLWRVGIDYEWYGTPAAFEYLSPIAEHFSEVWASDRAFVDSYLVTGNALGNNSNLSVTVGILTAVQIAGDSQISSDIYNSVFVDTLVLEEENEYAYWGNSENYYDSNWVWLGLGLLTKNLPNLWAELPS